MGVNSIYVDPNLFPDVSVLYSSGCSCHFGRHTLQQESIDLLIEATEGSKPCESILLAMKLICIGEYLTLKSYIMH